ncbi:MAG: HD domain-containing protein [Candidatus Obscuribacterales bacterium]|nr:HD domain-containing protein [Candidatus Obscuribacterales bacterium]
MQVRTQTPRKRSYLDPIHHDIVLDRSDSCDQLIIDLIDTAEFQRLRRIHQLGVSYFTFQGAEGSRFTHSVGVMHIARQLLDILKDRTPQIEEDKPLVLATALLHDLGHGPYSHVTEKILGYDHENWSCAIIEGNTEVNSVLSAFNPSFPKIIKSILKKTHRPKYMTDMVSSQLDCDRFDYLLRDSYLTGTAYGLFALHRILSSMEIDPESQRIIVAGEKGQAAVEDYLFARSSMYQQVYYHRKNLAARALLSRIIKRAKLLADDICFIDDETRKWLLGDELKVQEYLCLDDVQMSYHIKRWAKDKDPIMKDLACRFLNRKLFNATKLPYLNLEQVNSVKTKAKQIVASAGLDPEYYIAIETTGLRPYDYYRPEANHPQTNIMVRTEHGEIRELSTISPTVEALVRGSFDTYWLIYPSEVRDKITSMLESDCRAFSTT